MRKQIAILFHSLFPILGAAQEVSVGADFVSSYIWRGMKCGNAAIQPALDVSMKGFTLSAWGSTEFQKENNEIDLALEYEYKGLKLNVTNYFTQTEEAPFRYFNYNAHSTGHTFEIGAGYTFGEKLPLSIRWYTAFAGNDYCENEQSGNEQRAWSSYCELSYPFSYQGIDFALEAGVTPWEGMYSPAFNVVNIGFSAQKAIQLTDRFALPVFGKLTANPYEKQLYFGFGICL